MSLSTNHEPAYRLTLSPKNVMTYLQNVLLCFIDAGYAWKNGYGATLSAAIAYYTMLSLAPLLLIAVAIVGLIIGRGEAVQTVIRQVELFLGEDVAFLMQGLIEATTQPSSITIVTAVSLVVTLFAASSVFNQMQIAFNIIWEVNEKEAGIRLTIVRRLVSFVLVIGIGLGMVALIILNVVLSVVEVIFQQFFNLGVFVRIEDDILVLVGMFVLLSVMYKLIPSVNIAWRDLWSGALVAAVLFTVSRYLITLYLRQSVIVPTYGAASSLVVLLVWVYFATMMILYGAAFTRAYAYRLGSYSGEPSPILEWSEQLGAGVARVRRWREKDKE